MVSQSPDLSWARSFGQFLNAQGLQKLQQCYTTVSSENMVEVTQSSIEGLLFQTPSRQYYIWVLPNIDHGGDASVFKRKEKSLGQEGVKI